MKIVLTTGDVDGIGLEVSLKALAKLKPVKGVSFYLLVSSNYFYKAQLRNLSKFFKFKLTNDLGISLGEPTKYNILTVVLSDQSPANWVETCAELAKVGKIDAIVTAPLSKTEIQRSGLIDIGHTDILKRISGVKHDLYMAFLGDKFNVALATGHIEVKDVESAITEDRLIRLIELTGSFLKKSKITSKKIGVLGLNPHAGDQGVISHFEDDVLRPILEKAKHKGHSVVGPMVPDAAFIPKNLVKYGFYIALYHDQGLIPFKAIHGFDSGVHVTLGLPFVRTSVDHGTAKDIFGKNKANANSMFLAIKWAIRLAGKRGVYVSASNF